MAGTNTPYMREYQREKYARLRAEMIIILGGKCAECGSTDDLQMDHKNPAEKLFGLEHLVFRTRETFLWEVAKCQLLCGPHHRIKSAREHGIYSSAPRLKKCVCGKEFYSHASYCGHRRWCALKTGGRNSNDQRAALLKRKLWV